MVGVSLVGTPEPAAALADRVGLAGMLSALDRRARRTVAPGRAVRRALTWEAADRRDRAWWPQGVALSPDGGVLAVSWYSSTATRITFLDLRTRCYRHVPLVSGPDLAPVRVHAGGLAWCGPWLYVAATRGGLLACRLDDLARVPGRGLVLPVGLRYRAEGSERFRYSFCSLDASGPALVAGEYGAAAEPRRLARFPLDPDTWLIDESAVPTVTADGVVPRTQGVAVAAGRLHLTRSRGPWTPGSVWSGLPGALREHRWAVPMGPEDLALSPDGEWLWTVTEHPRRRWIVAIRTPAGG